MPNLKMRLKQNFDSVLYWRMEKMFDASNGGKVVYTKQFQILTTPVVVVLNQGMGCVEFSFELN